MSAESKAIREAVHAAAAVKQELAINAGLKLTRSKVTGIESKVWDKLSKTEQDLLRSMALTVEDNPWQRIQFTNKFNSLAPSYDPTTLALISWQNNTLRQCIEAMKANVDGTGYDIERADGQKTEDEDEEEDPQITRIKGFFDQAYPGISFQTMRQRIRDDLETCGNGYLEVIRDMKGRIALFNPMDAKLTRMIRHDDLPVAVTQKVWRDGPDEPPEEVTIVVHERRYVQIIGLNVRFFKQFQATRNLNAQTGIWDTQQPNPNSGDITKGTNATEVIHFTNAQDVLTPYGIPKWVNQLPSILGSRKAEELNLEFFNHGGVPPVIIMIQGGTLSSQARAILTRYLAGEAKFKQRGVVMEIAPSGGDLNSAGQVKATVERFGSEKQQDSMFEKYDDKCTQRIRMAFRLPPLMIGLAQDFNYATAQTAMMMAEDQVFAPERRKFDEIINATIMRELDPTGTYIFKSKFMTAKFMDEQIKAMLLAKGLTDPKSYIDQLNDVAGLHLKFDEEMANMTLQGEAGGGANPTQAGNAGPEGYAEGFGSPLGNSKGPQSTGQGGQNTGGGSGGGKSSGFQKSERMKISVNKRGFIRKMDQYLFDRLSKDWSDHFLGFKKFKKMQLQTMTKLMKSMTPSLQEMIARDVAKSLKLRDPEGTRDLISCSDDIVKKMVEEIPQLVEKVA